VRGFLAEHAQDGLQAGHEPNPSPDTTGPDTVTSVVSESDTAEGANPVSTGSELGKHPARSERAAVLLPALYEAIAAEAVPPNPSVRRIRSWAREHLHEPLGVPTAQHLRDAVTGLHLITDPAQEVT